MRVKPYRGKCVGRIWRMDGGRRYVLEEIIFSFFDRCARVRRFFYGYGRGIKCVGFFMA